jgi:Tfp pilus assembly protein PilX
MKAIVKRLARDEKGAALVLVLILLLISGLIIGPLLSYMGTGLITGQVYEMRTDELYAADAGVEDAVWKIQNKDGYLPCSPSSPSRNYTITDVNGKSVAVDITSEYAVDGVTFTYRILSTATGDGSGTVATVSGTQIEAYVTAIYDDLSGILDNVITSTSDYTLQGGHMTVEPQEGEEHGPVNYYEGDWPEAGDLAEWYRQDVIDEVSYNSDKLYVEDYASSGIGPFYRDGTLDIVNAGTKGLTLSLNGTIYITGDTLIGMTDQVFTLDLNGQTIFVESDTMGGTGPGGPYALQIGTKCTITGSGCIIAVGDIQFKPNLDCSEDDYVLVMSVEGQTYMQPNGDFYGTLAGKSEVYLQNGYAFWNNPDDVEGGLNFPGFTQSKSIYYSIYSWEVIRLSPDDFSE